MATPAAPKTIKLSQVLQHASRLALTGEHDKAVSVLESAAAQLQKKPDTQKIGVALLLVQTAASLLNEHPAIALTLIDQALALEPNLAAGWNLLASARDRLGDLKGAKEAVLWVVNHAESTPEQMINASNLLVRFGEDRLAMDAARKAFETLQRPLAHASTLLYIALKVADWPLVDELTAQLLAAHQAGQTPKAGESPRTNLQWCSDEAINIAVVSDWSKRVLPKIAKAPALTLTPLDGRKLRVGYLSSDFRDHPTSRLINGLFRHHDRDQFELFLYCSGWDDGSTMRREVESHMDHVHSVAKLSDEAAAKLIRSHGIDVLVELNGPTRANRMGVLAYRPAPVQIDYLGWPGSVGGRVVDYVVGDAYTVPPGREALYPEKVIRLDAIYQVNDYAARQQPAAPTRAEMGLPEGDVRVVGMFNAINKVHGQVWAAWMRILKAVPNSVLWILDPGPVARENIAKATRAHGVSPRRIIAAPAMKQEAHLARLQCCDLMLDPWPYGGHTSTSDALFAGVPVVALAGTNFAGRVSGGLLKAAGMEVLVQPDVNAYVKLAVRLLRDPLELDRINGFVRERAPKSDVFNAKSKARQLEAAYRTAFERALKGLAPVHINLQRDRPAVPPAGHSPGAALPVAVPSATVPAKRDAKATPIILVCGPWSSGTSAMAGFMAKAGLPAPGPFVEVNDPRTPQTYEMRAFRDVLRTLASEQTLQRSASSPVIVTALTAFRDGPLAEARREAGLADDQPVLLKHALAALMLPELCHVFDTRLVCVLRPLADIEATRARRKWQKSFGASGASLIYGRIFDHLVNHDTPFRLVRYTDLMQAPDQTLDDLLAFCGIECDALARQAALGFVARPDKQGPATGAVEAGEAIENA